MGDRITANGRGIIQWVVGLICSGLLAWMLYLSGGPGHSYDLVAIVGMLVLIAILLGYQDLLINLFQIWRGGRNDQTLAEIIEEMNANANDDDRRQATQHRHREGDSRGDSGDGDHEPGRHS